MAIIHQATLTPSKPELVSAWLGGPVDVVGSYRFDDPSGEVGVEAFILRRGGDLLHVVLTYRGAPLDGADLVGTMEHSALGPRWVYDGATDPVARDCYLRALVGEQTQAVMEVWDGDTLVRRTESAVRVGLVLGDGAALVLARALDGLLPDGAARLDATWDGGSAPVAWLA